MASTPPKFVWTMTPTVYPPSLGVRRREEVPMPPLKPNATVPVPAPTEPSSTRPPWLREASWSFATDYICGSRLSFGNCHNDAGIENLAPPSFVQPTFLGCSINRDPSGGNA